MDVKQGKRNPNFSFAESNLLLQLIKTHKHILESRRTDTIGRYEKAKAWDLVVDEFNKESGECYRDKATLMSKYDNLKRSTKKKACEEKKYAGGTGGGPCKPVEYNPIENQMIEIVGIERVEGLPSYFDNDEESQIVAG